MQLEFPRNLRYSPVNFLIVDWGFNGKAFNNCGLPTPKPCEEPGEGPPALCRPLPIAEAIDAMGWQPWLPEVIVGVEDPDEEIAASYVRDAAIEFAKYTRALQRQILIPLQEGVCTYPVEPYAEEQIIGAIAAGVDERPAEKCHSKCAGHIPAGGEYVLDTARNEVHLEQEWWHRCRPGILRMLVWAAPTEQACAHDVFLYDRFRHDITVGARQRYVSALHFRDAALMRSLQASENFELVKARAKGKVLSTPSSQPHRESPMWSSGCSRRGSWA